MPYRGHGRYQQLNRRLLLLEEKLRWRNKLLARLHGAERALYDERGRLEQLAEALRREQLDVTRLEGATLRGLVSGLLGTRERRLERERREALEARLRHDEARAAVEALEAQSRSLRRQIEALGDIRAEQRALLEEKTRRVREDDGVQAAQLRGVQEALAAARTETRELEEALDAGNRAYDTLLALVEQLDEARSLLSLGDAARRLRIGATRRLAREARRRLQILQLELADVDLRFSPGALHINRLPGVADLFAPRRRSSAWDLREQLVDVRDRVAGATGQLYDLICHVVERLEAAREASGELQLRLDALLHEM